jgi:hypothetical protein
MYHPEEVPAELQPLIYQGITATRWRWRLAERDDVSLAAELLKRLLRGKGRGGGGGDGGDGGSIASEGEGEGGEGEGEGAGAAPLPTLPPLLGTPANLAELGAALGALLSAGGARGAAARATLARVKAADGASQNHLLLHAVHAQRPALVALLLGLGLDPLTPGSVHPYTGDGLRPEESCAISPLRLARKMVRTRTVPRCAALCCAALRCTV